MHSVGWMYCSGDVENTARNGARHLLSYLFNSGDISKEVFDKYYDNVAFSYKCATWYSRVWKKIWPWADKDSYILNISIMDLPKPEEKNND